MKEKQEVYNPFRDVVIAMLSTGGYFVEKTFNHIELLGKNGLTDPLRISSMDQKELAIKLVSSGYDRGPILTAMYSERLSSFGEIMSNKYQENKQILLDGTQDEVAMLLKKVKGIGPMVIKLFLTLRDR